MPKAGLVFIVLVLWACATAEREAGEAPNRAYQLGKLALEATANDTERYNPRPTITSRYLALVFTAVFDAWSRYDDRAEPVYLKGVERLPAKQRTIANKEVAITYAAYVTLQEYFPADSLLFRQFMNSVGLDPKRMSSDPGTAAGVGFLAARAVIDARRGDGANQYGEENGSEGRSYFDYTAYMPVNTPDHNRELARWQPKYFADGQGGRFAPGCLTPHWGKVRPVALDSAGQFRPAPPPAIGSAQLQKEVAEVVALQAALTDEERALVEFMRDGPKSVQQAGHWLIFAQRVSERDQHTLDDDVKLYFLNQVAAMDAFVACWDAKMYYDFARPYALVHAQFAGQMIRGWAGPELGMQTIRGEDWRPYSPDNFLCPPFPSYVSGHSTVSGACAEVLRLFTGNDHFGESVKWVPGTMTEPQRLGDTVHLQFNTFTETANMAGFSRVLGGYHIQSENEEGLTLGRKVAHEVWRFYQEHALGSH